MTASRLLYLAKAKVPGGGNQCMNRWRPSRLVRSSCVLQKAPSSGGGNSRLWHYCPRRQEGLFVSNWDIPLADTHQALLPLNWHQRHAKTAWSCIRRRTPQQRMCVPMKFGIPLRALCVLPACIVYCLHALSASSVLMPACIVCIVCILCPACMHCLHCLHALSVSPACIVCPAPHCTSCCQ